MSICKCNKECNVLWHILLMLYIMTHYYLFIEIYQSFVSHIPLYEWYILHLISSTLKNYWCEQRISFFTLLVFASVPLCLYFFGIFLSLSLFLSSRSFLNKINHFFSSSSSNSSSTTFQNRWVLHAIRYCSEIFYSLLSSHQ